MAADGGVAPGAARLSRPPGDAQVELVRRWLHAFGPGTTADMKWWTGWTVGEVKRALAAAGAVEVGLEGGAGWLLADDIEPVSAPEPAAALLPALDPTPMGWAERAWYLGDHKTALFDTSGNIGPSVWWDGRIVGGWAQRKDGSIAVRLLGRSWAARHRMLSTRRPPTSRQWLGPVRVTPRFRTPLERELSGCRDRPSGAVGESGERLVEGRRLPRRAASRRCGVGAPARRRPGRPARRAGCRPAAPANRRRPRGADRRSGCCRGRRSPGARGRGLASPGSSAPARWRWRSTMNMMLAPPKARPTGKAQPRPGTTASRIMLAPKAERGHDHVAGRRPGCASR